MSRPKAGDTVLVCPHASGVGGLNWYGVDAKFKAPGDKEYKPANFVAVCDACELASDSDPRKVRIAGHWVLTSAPTFDDLN